MRYKIISVVFIIALSATVFLQAMKINALNTALDNTQQTIESLLIALGVLSF